MLALKSMFLTLMKASVLHFYGLCYDNDFLLVLSLIALCFCLYKICEVIFNVCGYTYMCHYVYLEVGFFPLPCPEALGIKHRLLGLGASAIYYLVSHFVSSFCIFIRYSCLDSM